MALKLTKETLLDFANRRKRNGHPLKEEECALIMTGIFRGLNYIHDEKNIIHRDLKPGNILVGSYRDLTNIKIIDFGLGVTNKQEFIMDYSHCGTLLY